MAGEEDFSKACDAVSAMFASGRGLFITGDAGCGKTKLLYTMRDAMNIPHENWYYCKEPEDIKLLRVNSDILDESLMLDDIGAEEIIKEFGNTVDAVGDIIQRYHYRGKGRFYATTNLNSQQINERYGGRILDRILEMCVVLHLSGKSKRQRIVFK